MFEAHFQSFEDRGEKGATAPRLAALRAELKQRGLDGFIVPRADRYQNEYVPPCAERLAWLTGFTGSAGLAIVLADRAVIFVDGRYLVQVRDEVDASAFTVEHLVEHPPAQWIEENLPAGAKLGYSPWLHTVDGAERLAKACEAAKASLVAVADNPIDSAWADRPAPPLGAVVLHDLRYAGEEASSKLKRVRADLEKITADALIVSDPQSVSWLFNIRGNDVPHTPVVLASAIVPKDGRPALYIDRPQARATTCGIASKSSPMCAPMPISNATLPRSARRSARCGSIPASARKPLRKLIADNGGKVVRGGDPIVPMKAVKNAVEIAGAKAAQLRDGAAVTRFLAWFDGEAPRGRLTEIDAVEALESFRRDTGALKDVSFPTIAGAGPDGAIVHYRVSRQQQPAHRARTNCFWSIPAANTRTARPTSRARLRSARRAPTCAGISPSCSRAISPSRARFFPTAHRARSSILWRDNFSGATGSISITAPATASAAISRCTKGRRAFPSSAARRSSAA